MKKKGLIYFHQGWTDIAIQLPLINHYAKQFDLIKVVVRHDAISFVKYYTRSLKNVEIVCLRDTVHGHDHHWEGPAFTNLGRDLSYLNIEDIDSYDFLFHGQYDPRRKDQFRLVCRGNNPGGLTFYAEWFYALYGIDFMTRIKDFSFERDKDLEEQVYQDFINLHGTKYVLYHDDPNYNNPHPSTRSRSSKINFQNKIQDCAYVNVNAKSEVFLDYIKVFENAEEIHFIDSVWGCLYFQLDAKYKIFKDKTIYAHPLRGLPDYFTNPCSLPNWKIITPPLSRYIEHAG